MKLFRYIILILPLFLFICCSQKSSENSNKPDEDLNLSGQLLAEQYCSACHLYVAPDALPKDIWEKYVLPQMAFRMGIYPGEAPPDSLFEKGNAEKIVRDAKIYPLEPMLSDDRWKQIKSFYLKEAVDNPYRPKSKKNQVGLTHFNYHPSQFSHTPPLTNMVKILPGQVVFSDGKRNGSSINFLNQQLEHQFDILLPTTPIHYYESQDTIWLTTIGKKMLPSDAPEGAIQKLFSKEPGGVPNAARKVITNLQRPVDVVYEDLNQDGRQDIVVCEFGNLTGKLSWYENLGDQQYMAHVLKKAPGASIARVQDVNQDGRKDIIALMAQGDEGIYLFINKEEEFEQKRLLRFSPLYGSTFFDYKDLNNDGHCDIIYTCGDNADQSPILKDYHGIYIFLNDGQMNFEKKYFYHLNGAYKAVAEDFDLDGDLDLAAISFFPDYVNSPHEGFVYLQNQGKGFNYRSFTFPEVVNGRWIVMDAGDLDKDGDLDIALGSFVGFEPDGDTTNLYKFWLSEAPSVIVLENTIR